MKKRYHATVIGCGTIGLLYSLDTSRPKPRSHAEALYTNARISRLSLVDPDERKLAIARKLFPRAKTYLSAVECLEKERPDLVVIASPTGSHAASVDLADRFGVSMIICEKPLAQNEADARRIQRTVHRRKPIFVVNYQRRFFPLFDTLKKVIARGAIGSVFSGVVFYDNGLYNNGGHAIDALHFLLDERVVSVSGMNNEQNKTHPLGDVNVDGIAAFRSGATILLKSFDKRRTPIHEIHLFGTRGTLHVVDYGFTAEVRLNKKTRPVTRYSERRSFTTDAIKEAFRLYEGGTHPRSSLEAALSTLAVLTAFEKSASRKGKKIEVRYSTQYEKAEKRPRA